TEWRWSARTEWRWSARTEGCCQGRPFAPSLSKGRCLKDGPHPLQANTPQASGSIARFAGAAIVKGTVVLSHGLESGPQATKVSALARVAGELGWTSIRPDYRDLDATRELKAIRARIDRAVAA